MFVLITGGVATGKSSLANYLKKKLPHHNFKVINDKDFSKENNVGKINDLTNTYEVDVRLFSLKLKYFFKKNKNKNIIFEGHLFSEIPKHLLKSMDFIFLARASEKKLRERMQERGYDVVKIEENILCVKTNYFENLLGSKNIDFIPLELGDDLKVNFKRLNKFLKMWFLWVRFWFQLKHKAWRRLKEKHTLKKEIN